MSKPYKLLICKHSTGQVLNTDAITLFSDENLPYIFFESIAEAEIFTKDVFSRVNDIEVIVYHQDEFIKMIYE